MIGAADLVLRERPVQTWAERNQRWLSERLAYWRERIEQRRSVPIAAAAPPDRRDRSGTPVDPLDVQLQEFEPAALRLRALFGLSPFETELVIVAAGLEIDAGLRDAVAQAQSVGQNQPVRLSFALALALLPDPHWDALSPLGPLRHWCLIDFDTTGGFNQSLLRIDERVMHYLTGVAALDERVAAIAQFEEREPDEALREAAVRIAHAASGRSDPLIVLANATREASLKRAGRSLAHSALRHMGLRMLWVDLSGLNHGDGRDLLDTARRLDREAALAHAGLALTGDGDAGQPAGATLRFIAALRSPLVVLGGVSPMQAADLPSRRVLRFNVPVQHASPAGAWPPAIKAAADRALQQFHVDASLLEQALDSVADGGAGPAFEAMLWDALRESARGGLDALAQRIDSRAGFEDLVVPPLVSSQLREIATQLRHRQRVYEEWGFGERDGRGLGIAALFAGESGTGKTLAAEAIANEARLDLYRIDLSSVVSKYIGETEKNLSRLFDAAERSGAVLLFDEADALFGKRSEVKDSHDRYANIEVAYLLQRIEGYRGLAILTSNLKSALDRAFLRRIRFVVQFPFPDEAAREQIWRRQFPAPAPLGPIEYAALSRLQLSGGHIRSVALNAAFQAAGQGEPIGQAVLMKAARAEFAKLERTFNSPGASA
jgi:hypothetical protein